MQYHLNEAKEIFIGSRGGDVKTAVTVLAGDAERGVPSAAYYLAEGCAFGRGVGKDEEKSFSIAFGVTEAFPPAKAIVAFDYFFGRGTEKNEELGLRLFREAANAGCIIADMFLSDNRDCVNYATDQFSRFMPRGEKISALKALNNDMATAMLFVYATDEERRRIAEKFDMSEYRYAKVRYLFETAARSDSLRDFAIGGIRKLADEGYAYAYDLLGDLYENLGDFQTAAECYVDAFACGSAAGGTKFVSLTSSRGEICENTADEFVATAYRLSECGNGYAGFLLAYYIGSVMGYDCAAAEIFKRAAENGSVLADKMLRLHRADNARAL